MVEYISGEDRSMPEIDVQKTDKSYDILFQNNLRDIKKIIKDMKTNKNKNKK